MKFDTLNGIMTFVLGVLVVLAVYFALKVAFITHESRSLQHEAIFYQTFIVQTEQAFNDAQVYNQKYQDPVLAQILRSATKPANR